MCVCACRCIHLLTLALWKCINRDQQQFPSSFVLWQYHHRCRFFYIFFCMVRVLRCILRPFSGHLCNNNKRHLLLWQRGFYVGTHTHLSCSTFTAYTFTECREDGLQRFSFSMKPNISATAATLAADAVCCCFCCCFQQTGFSISTFSFSKCKSLTQIKTNQLLCTHVVFVFYVLGPNNCPQLACDIEKVSFFSTADIVLLSSARTHKQRLKISRLKSYTCTNLCIIITFHVIE